MLVKLLPGEEWIYTSRLLLEDSLPSLGSQEKFTVVNEKS